MILMTIIRVITGTALVLGLAACGPVWWAAEALSFRKDGEVEYEGLKYSVRYQTNSQLITTPVHCIDGKSVKQTGEIVVTEFADMGTQTMVLSSVNGPEFTCGDIENWRTKVYPIAAKACRSINQTPKSSKRDRGIHLAEDGSVEIWGLCV